MTREGGKRQRALSRWRTCRVGGSSLPICQNCTCLVCCRAGNSIAKCERKVAARRQTPVRLCQTKPGLVTHLQLIPPLSDATLRVYLRRLATESPNNLPASAFLKWGRRPQGREMDENKMQPPERCLRPRSNTVS